MYGCGYQDPKTQRNYQLCHDELCILISKNPGKVPTLAGLALHLHIQKPRQSTNYGRMSCVSSYPKIQNKVSALYLHIQKPRKSTNFGKMFSASSYPKIETKDQLWQDELVIFVSKNSNKVPTLVGCALHRHIQKIQRKYKLW